MSRKTHMTVDERIELRDRSTVAHGKERAWQDVALDLYIAGEEVSSICELCDCTSKAMYNGIAKAALYRLMKQNNCERLDDIPDTV